MILQKSFGKWTFECFDPETDADAIHNASSDVRRLLSVWASKRAGRKAPRWKDFDFVDFRGLHGRITVYEIRYDPFDWTVRLSGTTYDTVFRRNRTGNTLNDVYVEAINSTETNAIYEMACENMLISRTMGPLNVRNRDFHEVEYLELPCSDDGSRATHSIELISLVREGNLTEE